MKEDERWDDATRRSHQHFRHGIESATSRRRTCGEWLEEIKAVRAKSRTRRSGP